jgi:tetrahydromethanopterin S-methyltransferase subunit F
MPENDWVVTVTDNIDRVVSSVRDKTTRPAIVVARGLVFGVLAGVAGIAAVVLLAIGLIRLLNNVVPGEVWISEAIVGSIFVLVGFILMRLRRAATT